MKLKVNSSFLFGLLLLALSFLAYLFFGGLSGRLIFAPLGIMLFIAGFKLTFANHSFFQPFRKSLPFIAGSIVLMWLFYMTELQDVILNSSLGQLFTKITVFELELILRAVGIKVTRIENVIAFPNSAGPFMVGLIAGCSGLLSVIVFVGLYAVMLLDYGRGSPPVKLFLLLVFGSLGVYFASLLRALVVLLVGYTYGLGVMVTVHNYLGYALFLLITTGFWAASSKWIQPCPDQK